MSERRRSSRRGGWFGLSILLHAIAILALIFLTPIRKVFLEEFESGGTKSEPSMSSRELSQVAERLEEISEEHLERNLEAMRELLDRMQEVNDAEFEEFVVFEHSQIRETPEKVDDVLEQAVEAMEEAKEKLEAEDLAAAINLQAVALSHQEEIRARLELVQASAEVRRAQEEASEIQRKAVESAEQTRETRAAIQSLSYQMRYPEQQIPLLEERVPKARESVTAAEKRLEESDAKLKEAREALAETQREKADDAKAIERAQKRTALAQSGVERSQKHLDTSRATLEKYQNRLNEFQTKVAELKKAKAEQERVAVAAEREAKTRQTEAIDLQATVAEKIREEVARRVAELEEKLGEKESVQAELTTVQPTSEPVERNVLELYEAARAAERQLAEKYRQGRAMRLAMLQNVPFNAALEAVDLVVPVRPELPAATLESEAKTGDQLEAKKKAVREAMEETGSMVVLGHSLLDQALQGRLDGIGGSGGAGKISLAAIQARSAQMQQLEALASQETSGRAVDVSRAMMPGDADRPVPGDPEDAPEVDKSILPTPGRTVKAGGDGAQWMAVTEWYLVGPFDNTGRANIDRVFPPESVVDLNAVYLGKGNRPIRWTFTKSVHQLGESRPANWEPYGIWYAFTEVKFDRDCDLWISMGSDDKGKVWINDVPVWVSASHHKNWHPGEAQRRVHFRKGRNRILFRVENGQHGMGFSLWVKLES